LLPRQLPFSGNATNHADSALPLLLMERQQQAMQEFGEFLRRHHLPSIHAAHQRFRISREALTKMEHGWPPGLEIVERLATRANEDVNTWRRLYGYAPVRNALGEFAAGVQRLAEEKGEPILVSTEEMPAKDASEEQVAEALEKLRARVCPAGC
jgi:hypothetical protein